MRTARFARRLEETGVFDAAKARAVAEAISAYLCSADPTDVGAFALRIEEAGVFDADKARAFAAAIAEHLGYVRPAASGD